LGDIGVDGRIVLKRIVKKQGVKMWPGFVWIRIGFSGGLFVIAVTNLWVPQNASQEGLCSMNFVALFK
jgi:hypothetical protein